MLGGVLRGIPRRSRRGKGRVGTQRRPTLRQPGHRRSVRTAVVVEDDDHPARRVAKVVEALVGHPAGQCTVADDRHDPAPGGGAANDRGGQPVRVGQDGGCVAVLHPVVLRLGPRGIAGQATGLAKGGELGPATGEDLVDVGLVAGVPQQDVMRGVEHPVQGERQLDDPQVGAEVPAPHRDRVDDQLPDLRRQHLEGIGVQPAQVGGGSDGVQEPGGRHARRRRGGGGQAQGAHGASVVNEVAVPYPTTFACAHGPQTRAWAHGRVQGPGFNDRSRRSRGCPGRPGRGRQPSSRH